MPAKKATKTSNGESGVQRLEIPALELKQIRIRLNGERPLIMHKWSEKAKQALRDKYAKAAKQAKEIRNPEQEVHDATYWLNEDEGRYCFPISGLYGACSDAAVALGIAKSETRRAYSIEPVAEVAGIGEVVELFADSQPVGREDWGRVGIGLGTAQLIYRPMFENWHIDLDVVYDERQISASQIFNLFRMAGFCSGIGEWRPSAPRKRGNYGRFNVSIPEQE